MKEHFEQTFFDTGFPIQINLDTIVHFELHWHNYIEIFFTLEGSVEITTDDLTFILDEGDICFLNSGVVHSIRQTELKNRVMTLKISPSEKGPVHDLWRLKFDHYKYLNDLSNNKVPLTTFQQILLYLYHEYDKKLSGYENMVQSLLNALFGIMKRQEYLILKTDTDQTLDRHLDRLNYILQYLDSHYQEPLSLQDIADRMHMNYHYLSHFFKNIAGISFQDYLNQLRLDKSLQLLKNKTNTITSIALNTGFPSTKAYTRSFKNKYGILPSEYRQNIQKHSINSKNSAMTERSRSDTLFDSVQLSGDGAAFFDLFSKYGKVSAESDRHIFEAPGKSISVAIHFPHDHLSACTVRQPDRQSLTLRLIPSWNMLNYSALMSCYIFNTYLEKNVPSLTASFDYMEFQNSSLPFNAGTLLYTNGNIPSPACWALSALASSTAPVFYPEDDIAVSGSPEHFRIIIANRLQFNTFLKTAEKEGFTHTAYFSFHQKLTAKNYQFTLPSKNYQGKITSIGPAHGSVVDSWIQYGMPDKISSEDIAYLKHISVPGIRKILSVPDNTLSVSVSPLDCIVIELWTYES